MVFRLLLPITFLLFSSILFAQNALVRGTIIDLDSNIAVIDAQIILDGKVQYEAKTGSDGKFSVDNVVAGDYIIRVNKEGYDKYATATSISGSEVNLGLIVVNQVDINADRLVQDNIPTVSLSDSDFKDQSSQNVSGVLSASRDAFVSAASFNWGGTARFRIRGYDYENTTTLMNGVPMNDLATGNTFWSIWGGLNDVMRNRDNQIGLAATNFAFGGVGGANDLDSRASLQRKGLSVSYANSNRSYDHRLMATFNTGLLKNGWAVSISASRRWAQESYAPGTFFDGYSYFGSVEKRIGFKHSISLTTFGAPTRNGRSAPAVQEMNDIAGTNYYNPNWGFQDGKKRNASVAKSFQPLTILNHEWKINNKSSLETGVSFLTGKTSVSALDWYNAPDPRADYYKRFPSFITDSTLRAEATEYLRENEAARQINWDALYQANYNNTQTYASGVDGDSVTGKRSLYILNDRVTNNTKWNINSVYNNNITDNFTITAGASYQSQASEYYNEVNDLLGGDFYLDLNQFAERDFAQSETANQNDLNNPNRLLKEGDRWGYDYILNVRKAAAWAQPQFKFNNLELFVAAEISNTTIFREGNTRNGLFPDNSFGKGEAKNFFNYGTKAGVTYKINGRNYLYANGSYATRAPFAQDILVSPRTRDQFAPVLENTEIYSGEAGYFLRSPNLKGKATVFLAQFNNQTQSVNFYHEDFRTLVNYTLNNVDTRHTGIELAIDAKIYKGLSATAVASIGRFFYTDRPYGTITQDNDQALLIEKETIYAKNFAVGGSPQEAYNLGLSYRGKKFWFVNLNFNVFNRIYLNFNPARRTQAAVDLVEEGSEQWNNILEQEQLSTKFSEKYTLDLFGGKSWKLTKERIKGKYHVFMVLNVGVNNITNNRKLIVGGFEQLRFDFNDRNAEKFPSRYFYAYGTTYFVNLTFRFN
jgi:hypothetical protein